MNLKGIVPIIFIINLILIMGLATCEDQAQAQIFDEIVKHQQNKIIELCVDVYGDSNRNTYFCMLALMYSMNQVNHLIQLNQDNQEVLNRISDIMDEYYFKEYDTFNYMGIIIKLNQN
jgi:hypothetical protein